MAVVSPPSTPLSTVHLLTVHGVGGYDHLSNLLRTYQTFRANLKSVEAPILGEDQIPGWRLTAFEEGATPPFLKLEPRVEPQAGSVGAVCMYEVNYSGFSGVIRRNQPIDLTGLFIGLDLAVCAARQRPGTRSSAAFGGDSGALGECLQRVSGVLTAGTVPIIGLPSLLFRNYLGTFIAIFTRFFEDVATFALDKNGEQLVAAHLDRTIAAIAAGMKQDDRLVVAAHSLGSVVLHNYVVRQWRAGPGRVPDTVLTFGSPIGLLLWIWLFLDFEKMDFGSRISADKYFCWNPVSGSATARTPLSWINVVNCVDPIATAFPAGALDLSSAECDITPALSGGAIAHRFFGPAGVGSVGSAHTTYLNDKKGFLQILLRAVSLASGDPLDVPGTRTPAEHWRATDRVLGIVLGAAFAAAVLAAAAYCGLVARAFDSRVAYGFIVLFIWPSLTIGVLAFFQRLMLGGPTKRITTALIREMKWTDVVSFPYRLHERLRRSPDRAGDVDPMAPSPSYLARLGINALSFMPTLAAMAIPIAGTKWWTGAPLTARGLWASLWSLPTLFGLVAFMLYVTSCAAFELVGTWRRVNRILQQPPVA